MLYGNEIERRRITRSKRGLTNQPLGRSFFHIIIVVIMLLLQQNYDLLRSMS